MSEDKEQLKEQFLESIIREAQKLRPKAKVYIEVIGDDNYSNSLSVISDPLSILQRLEDITKDGELKITKIEIKDDCVL